MVPATQIFSEKAADIDVYAHMWKRDWKKFKLIERRKKYALTHTHISKRITITKKKENIVWNFSAGQQAKTERAIDSKTSLNKSASFNVAFLRLLSSDFNTFRLYVTWLFCFYFFYFFLNIAMEMFIFRSQFQHHNCLPLMKKCKIKFH